MPHLKADVQDKVSFLSFWILIFYIYMLRLSVIGFSTFRFIHMMTIEFTYLTMTASQQKYKSFKTTNFISKKIQRAKENILPALLM